MQPNVCRDEVRMLLSRVDEERRADNEVREALLGILARRVDEYRFGLRECSTDELTDLVSIWTSLNDGETPAETMLRLLGRQSKSTTSSSHGRRASPRPRSPSRRDSAEVMW